MFIAVVTAMGRVDDGRHHCFIVPCVPCSSSDQALTSHLVKSVVVKLQFCVALSGIHCLHCQDKIMYSCTIEAWHSFDSKMCQQSSGKIFMLCNAIFKSLVLWQQQHLIIAPHNPPLCLISISVAVGVYA